MKKLIEDFKSKHAEFCLEFRFVDDTEFKINSSLCEIDAFSDYLVFKTEKLNTVICLKNVTSFDLFVENEEK